MKPFIRTTSRISLRLFLLVGLLAGLLAVSGTPAYAATQTVSTCDESHLNIAISTAASGDTITFSCSGTITLASTLNITKNLTIDGTGQTVTFSGNNAVQVMYVHVGTTLNLNALTIAHGSCTDPFCSQGGGIENDGTLSVTNSTFSGNSAGGEGGGIVNVGTLNVMNSTFSNNSAGAGGAIYSAAGGTLVNSTFNGNSASGSSGGAIYFSGNMTISSCTISGNTASTAGGGIYDGNAISGDPGKIGNSIVALNTAPTDPDISSAGEYVLTHNDLLGPSAYVTASATNIVGEDPLLGPLQYNGGQTKTMTLNTGSPAINFGASIDTYLGYTLPTDQRGLARPQGGGYDVGAYEIGVIIPALTINDVTQNEGNSGTTSFRFVVSLSTPPGQGGVTFDIATQDNSATTANSDYVQKSLIAQTIPAGSSTYTFDVTVNGDLAVEPDEMFFVNVSNVTGATLGDGQGQGTILNDDVAVSITITWANPADITYGTALNATRLNATASVPGSFIYTPAAGTVLNAGAGQTLHVDFTPTDTANYNTTSADVTINVLKAPLTITADAKTKVYGDLNPTLTASYSGFVNGDTPASLDTPLSLNTTATTASPVGTYPITASGAADANYTITFVNGTLTVTNPITLTPTLPNGMKGLAYSKTITATNGTAPYSFARTAGTLPPGLALSSAGLLSGTPTAIGSFSFTVTATDAHGKTGSQSYTIQIIYSFTGFFPPVANPPKLNIVDAGWPWPINFSLGGNQGLNIFAANSPASQQINCSTFAPIGGVQPTNPPGKNGLIYSPYFKVYIYAWKTSGAWAGTCRQLIVTLNDGTTHVAYFRFR